MILVWVRLRAAYTELGDHPQRRRTKRGAGHENSRRADEGRRNPEFMSQPLETVSAPMAQWLGCCPQGLFLDGMGVDAPFSLRR